MTPTGASTQQYDTVIVGGGSAGCVLANRLSADPSRRVIVLEAGPDYGPYAAGRWPADILDAHADSMTSHVWGFPGGVPATRGRILGGCSAINGCGIVQSLAEDYDAWSDADPSWSFAALEPYLLHARQSIRARPSRADDLEPWRHAFLTTAESAGFPRIDPYDGPEITHGVGLAAVNAVEAVRWNAAFAYIDPVRDRANLSIRAGALVDNVVVDGGRATGVNVVDADGRRSLVCGQHVVLAAGTYATPAILVRSGIGPADTLRDLGIGAVRVLEGVGRGLRDHPIVDVLLRPSEALRQASRTYRLAQRPAGQVLLKAAAAAGDPWGLQLGPWYSIAASHDSTDAGSDLCGINVALTQPRSIGEVATTSPDPQVLPTVTHGFLTDPEGHDARALSAGVRLARDLAGIDPIASLARPDESHRWLESDEQLLGWLDGAVEGNFHPVGTCRMGNVDDPLAVVDGNGHVHGLEGLSIVDASIFPVLPRANPHLTVLAMAMRLGDHMRTTGMAERGRA